MLKAFVKFWVKDSQSQFVASTFILYPRLSHVHSNHNDVKI